MESTYDWKKHASQVVADDEQVERAFMDQAYQFLNNKGGALMKDPYRLGFEIVHKNDSNTRMVGIFAFRIGDNLLYVPVFFLNGEIKGTDLLYRHDSKTFVPLEDQWVKFLINKASRHMGQGIDTSQHVSPKDINLDDLAYPPGMQNTGGGSIKVSSDQSKGEYLKKFIIEDGGYEAIRKLASMIESNYEFAKAFGDAIPQDCFMPNELHTKVASLVKEAAAALPKPNFILSIGGIDQLRGIPEQFIEKAAEQMSKRGYNLWDDRDSGDAKVTKPVYTDAEKELTEVGEEPGDWDVLMHDGTTEKAFVARESDNRFDRADGSYPHSPYDSYENSGPSNKIVIFKNGDCVRSCYGENVYGERTGEEYESQNVAFEDLPKKMTSGETYRVFDAEGGTLSHPIMCKGVTSKGGIEYYTACTEYGDPFMITKNPDASRTDIGQNLLNGNAYFIKVKCNTSKHGNFDCPKPKKFLGTGNTLRSWCTETGIKEASLNYKEGSFQLRHSFQDQTRFMSRPTMAIKLACQLEIHSDTVEELLDRAENEESLDFMYGNPGDVYNAPNVKSAAMTRLSEQPNFQMYSDDDFDVDLDQPQQYILGSETRQDDIPAQHIGDAFDPSMGMGNQPQEDGDGLPMEQLMSYSPEQLAQLSQSDQTPQIFEHGLVGSLVQTFDAVSMIDKYIPDMEQALDKLGRLLFLFYWKPRDFENAYGVDDMSNMENQILSNFRSFGELTLELLKKAETMRKGTVSLAGE